MKSKLVRIPFLLFLTAFALLLIAGHLYSCKDKENDTKAYSINEGRFDINENEFITMTVSLDSLFINSSIKFFIENHTQGVLCFGFHFSVEQFDEGKMNWKQIQLKTSFNNIGKMLEAANMFERRQFLSKEDVNRLKMGRYRVGKNFSLIADLDDFRNEKYKDIGSFYLQTEFIVE